MLSEAQRLHVYAAIEAASALRDEAVFEIELENTAKTGVPSIDIDPGSGPAYERYRRAELEGVRLMAVAELEAFRGCGLFGRDLRKIIRDTTVDSLAYSFNLSQIQQQRLLDQLRLSRPEFDLPEWLVVPREEASAVVSPFCQLSADALIRLQRARAGAETVVDESDRTELERSRRGPVREAAASCAMEFAAMCIKRYVEHLAPPVIEEWVALVAVAQIPSMDFDFLGKGLLQLAEEHTRVTHKLSQVKDWAEAAERGRVKLMELFAASPLIGASGDRTKPEPIGRDSDRCKNRDLVDSYIQEVKAVTGRQITRREFWSAAGYADPTEFQRWQRCDERTTNSAQTAFERVLSQKPHLKR